jgi:hypothetical protein
MTIDGRQYSVREELDLLGANVADLMEKVAALEKEVAEARLAGAVMAEARQEWTARLLLPNAVVFANAAGRIAILPLDFVKVVVAGRQLDVTDVIEDGDHIVVRDSDRAVARIPKSLFVNLDSALRSCQWSC